MGVKRLPSNFVFSNITVTPLSVALYKVIDCCLLVYFGLARLSVRPSVCYDEDVRIFPCQANSRKYRGIFEDYSPEKRIGLNK